MMRLLCLLSLCLVETPVYAIVGGLPTTADQSSSGALSHLVHVTATGGVNHRAPYKGSRHVPSDQHGVKNVTTASCAGVLLRADWVLLPARCVVDTATPGGQTLHPHAITVRHGCGEHTPWSTAGKTAQVCGSDATSTVPVAAVFVHPCWDGPTPLGDHDVALLRLASPGVPPHPTRQRYAVLDDGSRLTSPGPLPDGTGGSGGAAAAGTELLFRGFGRTGPTSDAVSAALREAVVTVSDGSRCVEKFLIADDLSASTKSATAAPSAISPTSNESASSASPLGASTALDFAQRSICVGGGDGLSPAALRGGCPDGDEGGPLTDPSTGVLVGLWSRLTPAVSLRARPDLESPTTSDHMLEDGSTVPYCGGAGRGRFYDVFVRISYYKGWIESTVRNRYDGGVCSASRLLDSDLRCPPGAWGDAEGRDPLQGLLGGGGALSSLASATAMAETSSVIASSPQLALARTHHTAPTVATSAVCRLCPAGRYGARAGLETSDCSGVCSVGYFCPAGSTSPVQEPCDDVAFHCPEGTAKPRVTVAGYVTVTNATHFNPNLDVLTGAGGADFDDLPLDPSVAVSQRHGDTFHRPTEYRKASLAGRNLITSPLLMVDQTLCPRGFYCAQGVQRPCPQGTYGSDTGLATRQCTGHCFSGYYCPQQSVHPVPCPDGHWCDGNTSVPCPAGKYGEPGTKTSSTPGYSHVASSLLGSDACSGSCAPGHYCPPGSTSPTEVRCPPGTFGGLEGGLGSASCSGLCHPGYYCPGDGKSTNATRFACADVSPGTHLDWDEDGTIDDGLPRILLSGDGEVSSVYCPEGSGRPVPVSDGFYTLGGGAFDSKIVSYKSYDIETWPSGESVGNLADHVHSSGDHGHPPHRQRRDLSASSSAVDSAAHTGTDRVPGRTTAPSSPASSHLLSASTFLNGYTRSSQKLCEPGTYCRNGVRRLCPPGQYGVESGQTINTCSGRCAPGFFCTAGSTSPEEHPCPAGRFGATHALTTAMCSGLCAKGHYCPRNSTSERQIVCPAGRYGSVRGLGDANCGDGPRSTPRSCVGGVGGVSMAGNDGVSMDAVGAPPGSGPHNNLDKGRATGHEVAGYGDTVCGGGGPALCEPGYWCPPASVSPTQLRCGNTSVYCPEGSASPTLAPPGYYTAEGRIVEGEHRVTHFGGQQRGNAPATPVTTVYPNNNANEAAETSEFASNPPGDDHDYENTHFYGVGGIVGARVSEVLLSSSGGAYGSGGMQPHQNFNDGSQNERGRYHPLRSPSDLGGTSLLETQTRAAVLECPPGSYCVGGVRRACPRGRYGASMRLSERACDGAAAVGHWTRAGAVTATQMKCAPGRYADREGATSAGCTGPCDHGFWCGAGSTSRRQHECGGRDVYCPVGSRGPRAASRGWYTIPEDPDARVLGSNPDGTARERRAQVVCPEGYWCQRGVKAICAAGKYGRSKGLYLSQCSGECRKGYYCPAGSTKAHQVPCPAGRYGDRRGLGAASECLECPNGATCDLSGDAYPQREPRNR